MAVDLHNPELLLLPSPFLTDSESQDANKSIASATTATTVPWQEEQELSSGSGSSDETGDDDYIAELTRQMAHYTFREDDEHAVPGRAATDAPQKTWGSASSPQSTLWSPFLSSNRHGRSPPAAEDTVWDVTKVHLEQQRPEKLTSQPVPVLNSNQALTEYQIRAIQFYKLKQEQSTRKQLHDNTCETQQQSKERVKARPWPNSKPGPAQAQFLKWNQSQRAAGSGMRAVFLGGSGSRSSSCGTGVFLPRGDHSNNSSESRKKLGCSTVLIPARVAQALQLHFDQVGLVSRPNIANSAENQKRHHSGGAVAPATSHQYEMALPQEWTY